MERARRDRSAARDERALQVENGNYRAATGELTTQIQSLENVIDELGARAALDPAQARAMQKLPAVVKARAAGGDAAAERRRSRASSRTSLDRRRKTHSACCAICCRASRAGSATCGATSSGRKRWRRDAVDLAGARLADRHLRRPPRSVHRRAGFHQGLDISTDKGQPVYATADGTVESAAYTGEYGNLIVLEHDFGLTTRYGHLSAFNVEARPDGQARRRHRLRRLDRPLDRRAPALRDPRERQADQSAPAAHAAREPLTRPRQGREARSRLASFDARGALARFRLPASLPSSATIVGYPSGHSRS